MAMVATFTQDVFGADQCLKSIDEAKDIHQLSTVFSTFIGDLGMNSFFCGELTDSDQFPDNHLIFGTLDQQYIKRYWKQGNFFSDPVTRTILISNQPVRITSANKLAGAQQKTNKTMTMRLAEGLTDGYAFPLKGRLGRFAMVGIHGDVSGFSKKDIAVIEILCLSLYRRAVEFFPLPEHLEPSQQVQLTARERECLSWVAKGKTSWHISQILLITERTVQYHIENACEKLGVETRLQAVILAARTMEILP